MAVFAVLMAILALAIVWWGAGSLLWLHRRRKVSDVPGTVVGRDKQLTGRGLHRMCPVVDFTTPDGAQIRRTASLRCAPRAADRYAFAIEWQALRCVR